MCYSVLVACRVVVRLCCLVCGLSAYVVLSYCCNVVVVGLLCCLCVVLVLSCCFVVLLLL